MVMLGVIVLPASPKVVDAMCDRIRYGAQSPRDDSNDEDPDEPQEPPAEPGAATKTSRKPITTAPADADSDTTRKPAAA